MIPPPANGGAARRRRAYVYLLRSRQDASDYVGWTTDVLRRLGEHNQGLGTYTRRTRPFKKQSLTRAATGRPSQGVG